MGSDGKRATDPRCVCKDAWNVEPFAICDEFTPWDEDEGCAECCHDRGCHGPSKDERIASLEARIRELTEWRPMESAPRDGEDILLRERKSRKVVVAAWDDGEWVSPCPYGGTFRDDGSFYDGWLPIPEPGQ